MTAEPSEKIVPGPIHLAPVLTTLAFAWGFTLLLSVFDLSLPRPILAPFEEPPVDLPPQQALANPGPYLNTLLFIGVIGIVGALVVYAVRRGLRPRYFILPVVALIGFAVSSLFLLLALALLTFLTGNPLPLRLATQFGPLLSLAVALLVVYSLTKRGEIPSLLAAAYLGAGSGVLLGFTLPFWTAMVLFVAASAFDVYAVFRGHLRHLGGPSGLRLRGLMVEFRGMNLGLGDLVFYSMLIAFALTHLGSNAALAASVGLGAGFALTLLLLTKRGLIPALPLPLLGGLAAALVISIV